jgi:hypothetical protein
LIFSFNFIDLGGKPRGISQVKKGIQPLDLLFDNVALENVNQHTHLGLLINSDLTWSPHIQSVCERAGKGVGILSRLSYKNRKSLDIMYKSFIRPIMEYACVVWDGCTGKDSDLLEAVQLRAGRIVCGAIKHTSHALIYNELGWERLAERRERFKLILFHKMIYGIAPSYLQNLLPQSTAERNRYPVRSAAGLTQSLVRTRLTLFDNSFLPSTIRLWNNLPEHLRLISDSSTFKTAISPQPKAKNKPFGYGERKINIIHSRIRMGCSSLKAHLYDMHIINEPTCRCGANREDASHYLFECPLFFNLRNDLHETIVERSSFNLKTLFYGDDNLKYDQNCMIFQAVHEYIKRSNRFENT